MARKKIALQRITNDATRRATFKKRRKGLMKKASELATLCDVKACVVVYGDCEAQPEVWPSVAEAVPILARFKAMPELDQCKKMMNQEDFLRQRVAKLQEQIHKSDRENRERATMTLLLEAMLGHLPAVGNITVEELTSLGWMVEMRLNNLPKPSLQSLTGQMAATYATGNMDYMRTSMYQEPPQESSGWLDVVRTSGGNLTDLVCSGFISGNNVNGGVGPSSSRSDMTLLSSGFSWTDVHGPSFLPMYGGGGGSEF